MPEPFIIFAVIAVILIAVYVFAICPRSRRKFKLPKDKGYAHRGLWNENAPENSLAAFRLAVEKGYGIETDVHLTRDGVPVIFHDDTLTRMCNGDKRMIEECTLAELESVRLLDTDEKIPLFSDFLKLVDGKAPLLIELKGTSTNDTSLCDVIAPMLDSYRGEFVVESFNPLLLGKMKKIRPEIIRGQLVTSINRRGFPGNKLRNFALSALLTNCISRPDFIAYDLEYPHGISLFITTRILGAKRCVWTTRDIETYRKFIKKGDCPIFDSFNPEVGDKNA